jgi:uncharacterized protein YeaO (DUF488 family)
MAAKSATGAEIRRVYEPADSYGYRALADRLRPRGVRRDGARLDEWAKEVAPSDAQRGLQHPGQRGQDSAVSPVQVRACDLAWQHRT